MAEDDVTVTDGEITHVYILHNTIHMYSGITSGRMFDGVFLYTKILEINLFAFAYRLFHEDFSSIDGTFQNKVDFPSIEEKSP